jgi:predicted secreted acid phosphatase
VGDRLAEVDKFASVWGRKFIVLPNPTYGDWEGAIYNNDWKASAAEKNRMRKAHLRRWVPNPAQQPN